MSYLLERIKSPKQQWWFGNQTPSLLPRIDQPVLPFVVGPVNQQAHRTGDGRTHLFSEQLGTMEVAVIEID